MNRLWVKESGEQNSESIVFLHGLLASSQNWQVITKRLHDDFHTFCLDLPNHGKSTHCEEGDYEFMLSEFEAFIEESKLDNFYLVGHSLGGKLAMLYALKYPNKVKGLVVEDIAPKPYPMRYLPLMKAMDRIDLSLLKNRKAVDSELAKDVEDKAIRMFLLTNLESGEDGYRWRVNLKTLIEQAPKLMSFPQVNGVYSQKSLFLCGALSDYVEMADETKIKRYFSDCEIFHIEEATHWLHAEKPQIFCEYLIKFCKSD